MKQYVVLVAAGNSQRLPYPGQIPKQLIYIEGRPLLAHTLLRVQKALPEAHYLLVLPQLYLDQWQTYCQESNHLPQHSYIAGGNTRFQSVRKGIQSIPSTSEALVAIHDGVRPLVQSKTLQDSFKLAAHKGSAISTLPLTSSLRKYAKGTHTSQNREEYCLVQTPQTFYLSWLQKAFEQKEAPHFTDEATVLEAAGYPIHLFTGDRENIKITHPEDIEWLKWKLNTSTSTHPR